MSVGTTAIGTVLRGGGGLRDAPLALAIATTITDQTALCQLLETGSDATLPREAISFVARRLMEMTEHPHRAVHEHGAHSETNPGVSASDLQR
jgi:hypothetical protein